MKIEITSFHELMCDDWSDKNKSRYHLILCYIYLDDGTVENEYLTRSVRIFEFEHACILAINECIQNRADKEPKVIDAGTFAEFCEKYNFKLKSIDQIYWDMSNKYSSEDSKTVYVFEGDEDNLFYL